MRRIRAAMPRALNIVWGEWKGPFGGSQDRNPGRSLGFSSSVLRRVGGRPVVGRLAKGHHHRSGGRENQGHQRIGGIGSRQRGGRSGVVESASERIGRGSAHAVHALGALKATGSVERVVPLVFDKDAEVRHAAIFTLRQLKPGPQVTVPLIDQVLKETDPMVRMQVLSFVAEIGKPAVPSLVKLLDNEETATWGCIARRNRGGGRRCRPRDHQTLGAEPSAETPLRSRNGPLVDRSGRGDGDARVDGYFGQEGPRGPAGCDFCGRLHRPARQGGRKEAEDLAAREDPFSA